MSRTNHPRAETVAFIAGELRRNPSLSLDELQAIAKAAGFHVYTGVLRDARSAAGLEPISRSLPRRPRAETAAFVTRELRKNPDISIAELKTIGKTKGFNIYNLIVGQTRRELGLRPLKGGRPRGVRGSSRAPENGGSGGLQGRRSPGRPRKQTDAAAGLTELASHMRDLENEIVSLRAALVKIADIAEGA